jgi:hypothetical protein
LWKKWTKEEILELIPSRFCLVLIIVAVNDVDVKGENVTVLEDLVEIDSLILDLEGCDYVLSVNAYETLKRRCSQDWEAFKYLQERMHDVRISEQARNKMYEIIMIIQMLAEVNQMLGIR